MEGKLNKGITIKIPSHWGKRKLIGWVIADPFTCGIISSFKTRKEAIRAHSKHNPYSKEMPKIYPEYRYEGAVMNSLAIDWNEGFVPKKKNVD